MVITAAVGVVSECSTGTYKQHMEESQDDELAVGVAEDVRMPNLAAVELPLAVKPNESGIQAALGVIGGIEELSKVTADEVHTAGLYIRAHRICMMVNIPTTPPPGRLSELSVSPQPGRVSVSKIEL